MRLVGTGNSTLFEKLQSNPSCAQSTVRRSRTERGHCVLRPVASNACPRTVLTYCKRSRCLPPAARPRCSSCSCRTRTGDTDTGWWCRLSCASTGGNPETQPLFLMDQRHTAPCSMLLLLQLLCMHAARRTRTCVVASFSAWRQCRHASPCTPGELLADVAVQSHIGFRWPRGTGSLVADDD